MSEYWFLNPFFGSKDPESILRDVFGGWNLGRGIFSYLAEMSVSSLRELRDTLRELEDSIYAVYTPVLTGVERDPDMFDPEYLIVKSAESVEREDYAKALWYAKNALKAGRTPRCAPCMRSISN